MDSDIKVVSVVCGRCFFAESERTIDYQDVLFQPFDLYGIFSC